MNCPNCSAEIEAGIIVCPSCRAIQQFERTPLGIFASGLGIIATTLTSMIIIPLPLLMFTDISLKGFPWIFAIIGTVLAVGSFWYSKSTKREVWLLREK
jgi:hypothetical protein